MPEQEDDFQRAAANAKAEAGGHWSKMPTSEQAKAIYVQLRRIDALRASATMPASETVPSQGL
jgi:hypothetical protein